MIPPLMGSLNVTWDLRVAKNGDRFIGSVLEMLTDFGEIAILVTGVSNPDLGTSIICVRKDHVFIGVLQQLLIFVEGLQSEQSDSQCGNCNEWLYVYFIHVCPSTRPQ